MTERVSDDDDPVADSAIFARGSIVRRFVTGPNMLVISCFSDHTFVVVCEGADDGTLRVREYPTGDLDQVLGDGASQDRWSDPGWQADMRAIARWREANPGNDLVVPDHTDLVVWLLDQLAVGQVRPGSEYHEDMGPVLWLEFTEGGPPNVHAGTPTDSDWPFLDCSVVVFVPLPHYDAVKAAAERERAILADVPAW